MAVVAHAAWSKMAWECGLQILDHVGAVPAHWLVRRTVIAAALAEAAVETWDAAGIAAADEVGRAGTKADQAVAPWARSTNRGGVAAEDAGLGPGSAAALA